MLLPKRSIYSSYLYQRERQIYAQIQITRIYTSLKQQYILQLSILRRKRQKSIRRYRQLRCILLLGSSIYLSYLYQREKRNKRRDRSIRRYRQLRYMLLLSSSIYLSYLYLEERDRNLYIDIDSQSAYYCLRQYQRSSRYSAQRQLYSY